MHTDGYANELLKAAFSKNVGVLVAMLQKVWSDECIPKEWQESVVAPLPKCADTTSTGNFRGISLMSCLGKLFGRVLNTRLTKFLSDSDALIAEQGGFRETRECSEQTYALVEALRRRKALGLDTYVGFIDMRKAYDRVWRRALWVKLHRIGIQGKALRVLMAWYARVAAAVRVNDTVSGRFLIDLGVKQGCVLSPLLFNVLQ